MKYSHCANSRFPLLRIVSMLGLVALTAGGRHPRTLEAD